ncbi:hypothetical protein QPL79_02880 [Ignisphaera sp. 4213-co]|uniref:Mannose-6-phosphate isomerase n=1 Tax=Ignisphaera cupida TaxID=3050454 RepID=A0ABD4Z4S3_9CREN|nr:hypothetical protein [Ignisphaera sp. 4213-co]MDK6028306.1 hypothetical protein [Ignisphaera sp. 4213-co]
MDFEKLLQRELELNDGILKLKPNFVARFYPSLGRLGVKKNYVEGLGWFSERWLASCVSVLGSETYGLSKIVFTHEAEVAEMFFRDAIKALPEVLLGPYAKLNNYSFGVLTKLLDPGVQIPLHFHAMEYHARKYWRSNPKEEAYYYLPHEEIGPTPYVHLGLFPDVSEEEILQRLKQWSDDTILDYSPAYLCRVGEGFHVLSGVLHAPCTLLTLEAQEESDVGTILQALWNGKILPKEQFLLNGPKTEEEILEMINWDVNKDPKFHRKYRLKPEIITETNEYIEKWIFNPIKIRKFAGKEIVIKPGSSIKFSEKGPFLLYVHSGKGRVNNIDVEGKNVGKDELFISYEGAKEYTITNTSNENLVVYKIFPPNVY